MAGLHKSESGLGEDPLVAKSLYMQVPVEHLVTCVYAEGI